MTTTRLFAHFLGGNQTTFHASKQIDEKIQFIAPDGKKAKTFLSTIGPSKPPLFLVL